MRFLCFGQKSQFIVIFLGGLVPYFFNMLSEGANRQLQSTLLHIDENDDFGILLATALHPDW